MKTIIISLMIAILLVANAFTQDGSRVFNLNGGESWQVQFNLTAPATISGRFQSSDARADITTAATAAAESYLKIPNTVQNNIEILILDEPNYSARTGGRSYMSVYDSGRVTGGEMKVNLRAGSYRFVISNAHSVLASKTVRVWLDDLTQKVFDLGGTLAPVEAPIRPFLDRPFVVPAGNKGFIAWPLVLNGPARLIGKFSTVGGNNDIDFLVLDETNMIRWQAGLYSLAFKETGYVSGEQFVDVNLPAGRFYLVFNNRLALITQKTVTALIGVSALPQPH